MDWGVKAERGFSAEKLRGIHQNNPTSTRIHELTPHCTDPSARDAVVLVIALPKALADAARDEVEAMPFATKTIGRGGKVCDAHTRHLAYIGPQAQDADPETGQQPVRTWGQLPASAAVRDYVNEVLGDTECQVGCALRYPNIFECGIGWHGDAERRKSIVVRVGNNSAKNPLFFMWFRHWDAISKPIPVHLEHGEVAVACEVAVGTDWKSSSIPTVRHATGFTRHPVPPLEREKKKARAAKKREREG
jgi:hypothetical protein